MATVQPWLESLLVGMDPIAFALFGIVPPDTPPRPQRTRPARQRRRTVPRSERYYVGRRSARATAEVFVVDAGVEPLRARDFRSAARFDWGRDTAGTLELAGAILNHALADAPDADLCQRFAHELLAPLDRDGFVLSCEQVLLWAAASLPQATAPDGARPRGWSRAAARLLSQGLKHPWQQR